MVLEVILVFLGVVLVVLEVVLSRCVRVGVPESVCQSRLNRRPTPLEQHLIVSGSSVLGL